MTKRLFSGIESFFTPILISVKKCAESPDAKKLFSALPDMIITHKITNSYWCVTDKILKNKLKPIPYNDWKAIDKCIIEYYSKDNFAEINNLLSRWTQIPINQERIKILKSCFNVLLKTNDTDIYNITIPTLISQEDGFLQDAYDMIPQPEKDTIRKEFNYKNNQQRVILSEYLRHNGYGYLIPYLYSVIDNKTFLDGRDKIPQLSEEELEKFDKFRNRILHGHKDFLDYGTIKNFLQCWLELDMLIKVTIAIIDIKLKTEQNIEISSGLT